MYAGLADRLGTRLQLEPFFLERKRSRVHPKKKLGRLFFAFMRSVVIDEIAYMFLGAFWKKAQESGVEGFNALF